MYVQSKHNKYFSDPSSAYSINQNKIHTEGVSALIIKNTERRKCNPV